MTLRNFFPPPAARLREAALTRLPILRKRKCSKSSLRARKSSSSFNNTYTTIESAHTLMGLTIGIMLAYYAATGEDATWLFVRALAGELGFYCVLSELHNIMRGKRAIFGPPNDEGVHA
jgi:hypothetical protein